MSQPARRVAWVLLAALLFGLVAAWAKGQGTDGVSSVSQARGALGNLSTPWLLVAFLAGTRATRLWSAAALGLAATVVALTAFYVVTAAVVDVQGNGFLDDLRREVAANGGYYQAALVSGPLFGAIGGWWQRTQSLRAAVVAGLLLMLEPLVLLALGAAHAGGVPEGDGMPLAARMVFAWGIDGSSGDIRLGVYAAEFVAGLVVLVLAVRRWLRAD